MTIRVFVDAGIFPLFGLGEKNVALFVFCVLHQKNGLCQAKLSDMTEGVLGYERWNCRRIGAKNINPVKLLNVQLFFS